MAEFETPASEMKIFTPHMEKKMSQTINIYFYYNNLYITDSGGIILWKKAKNCSFEHLRHIHVLAGQYCVW